MPVLSLDPVGTPYSIASKAAAARLPKQRLGFGADNRGDGKWFLHIPYRVLENYSVCQKAGAGRCLVCDCRGMEMLIVTGEIVGRCKKQSERESPEDISFIPE